jgi:hypothetical protein
MAYRSVIFLEAHQDEVVHRYFNDPDSMGYGEMKEHLMQWECGEGTMNDEPPWCASDDVSEFTDAGDTYYLVSNDNLEYVTLVAQDNWD